MPFQTGSDAPKCAGSDPPIRAGSDPDHLNRIGTGSSDPDQNQFIRSRSEPVHPIQIGTGTFDPVQITFGVCKDYKFNGWELLCASRTNYLSAPYSG